MRAWLVVLERRGVFIWPLRVVMHLCVWCLVLLWFVAREEYLGAGIFFGGFMFGPIGVAISAPTHWLALEVAGDLRDWFREWRLDVARDVRRIQIAETSDRRGALTMEDEG